MALGFVAWPHASRAGAYLGKARLKTYSVLAILNLSAIVGKSGLTNCLDLNVVAGLGVLVSTPKQRECLA